MLRPVKPVKHDPVPAPLLKKSARYANVKSSLDTGASVTKARPAPSRKEVLKRMDEDFDRVSIAALYKMIVDHDAASRESTERLRASAAAASHEDSSPRVVRHAADEGPAPTAPYLIVDVRTPAEYDTCHIAEAISFPAILLNQDRMTKEVFAYRNRADAIIVLYADTDALASDVAHRLTTRGFTNVRVLSGGLRAVALRYPLLIDGIVPEHVMASPRAGGPPSPTRSSAPVPAAAAAAAASSSRIPTGGGARRFA